MGNTQIGLKIRDDFLNVPFRKLDKLNVLGYHDKFRKMFPISMVNITLKDFMGIFNGFEKKELVIFFNLFSDRLSTRDLIGDASSRKASVLTIFCGVTVLSAASLDDKIECLFRYFDLNNSSSLSQDEFTVFVACMLRTLTTLYIVSPSELTQLLGSFHSIIERPFQKILHFKYDQFRIWMQDESLKLVHIGDAEHREREVIRNVPIHTALGGRNNNDSPSPNTGSDEGLEAFLSGSSIDARSPTKSLEFDKTPSSPGLSSPTFRVRTPISAQKKTGMHSWSPANCIGSESFDPNAQSPTQATYEDDDDDDFMDPEEAIAHILSCLPQIDEGDLSSLPWLLNALKLLAEHNSCANIREVIPQILPLVCNVAACEDPHLASDAFYVLALIIDGAPEKLLECTSSVNEGALLDMCLNRSAESDSFVSSAAKMCLYRVSSTFPYGVGRTIGAILESGTLHENPNVVLSCASILEQCIHNLPDEIDAELDGRIGLVMSAICIWAHGETEDCKELARVIVVKLSLRFGHTERWEQAIRDTESVLVEAWNMGLDPTADDLLKMEKEQQKRNREKEIIEGCKDDVEYQQYEATKRGWLVPSGFKFHPSGANAENASDVSRQSVFDTAGAFRRKEIVTETKKIEVSKVLWNGKIEVWEEEEVVVKEVTHLEAASGEFAHRDIQKHSQTKRLNGSVIDKQGEKTDFMHVKNEKGDFSTNVDSGTPHSPVIQGGIPISTSSIQQPDNVHENHVEDFSYTVEEPETP